MLFPLTKQIGAFNQGAMANANYNFTKPNPTSGSDPELPYWVGATVHNSVIEQREYATQDGMWTPPEHLHILISNWNAQDSRATGSTPLWNKCPVTSTELPFIEGFVQYFIAQSAFVTAPMGDLASIVKKEIDMVINYLVPLGEYDCRLTSARIKATTYHEASHASHYSLAGCNYWFAYRQRISQEIALDMNPSYPDANSPYGDGTESDAGVVALGEMWGNTMECIYADRHYQNGGAKNSFAQGQGGFTENIQGIEWPNDIGGLNAYLRAIENFNPNLNGDLDRWIPMGLPNDLRDDRNDFNFPGPNVNDGVNVYTIQQLFLALQPDVRTVPAFRDRLLLQNGNNQSVEVNTLFNAYHY